jgi:intron-binding protein aquarius
MVFVAAKVARLKRSLASPPQFDDRETTEFCRVDREIEPASMADLQLRPALAPASDVSATTMNGTGSAWDQLAEKHWLKTLPRKARPDAIKEIWIALESDGFSSQTTGYLESLQIFERLLWATYNEECSDQHVLLTAIFFNAKQTSNLESWSVFADRPDEFTSLFRRILSLSLDTSLPVASRLALLNFVIGAFQSLEKDFVRKECAPLVSISIWHNLHDEEARRRAIEKSSSRKKAWKAAQKRLDGANAQGQTRIKFDRSWLFSMTLDFLKRTDTASASASLETTYCERFLEFLCDLTSQLPTRRYTNLLLKDLNIVSVVRQTKLYQKPDNSLLRDLTALLSHFQTFGIDDVDVEKSANATLIAHHEALSELQRIALKHFESKLKVLALSNFGSIDQRNELEQSFASLSDSELVDLAKLLGLRTSYPSTASIPASRTLLQQTLLDTFERPKDFRQVIGQLSISPTEETLYDERYKQHDSYDGSKPLGLPKLNLQYLSLSDFMWRSFQLHQAESFYSIRKDLEGIVKRMKPKVGRDQRSTIFDSFSKMAMPIDRPAIIEVTPPKVGTSYPGHVRSEVIIDVSRLTESMRREWDSLKVKDTVFLMTVRPPAETNGTAATKKTSLSSELGIHTLRTAEVVQILDENNKPLRDQANGYGSRSRTRHLLLDLDPAAFQADKDHGKSEVYTTLNVIARRQGRENNFKPLLDTVQKLVSSQETLPDWLQEVFLGYGDAKSASYMSLEDKILSIDFLDTFLDWEHLKDSFPGRDLEGEAANVSTFTPPYVLELFSRPASEAPSNPRKRRRDQLGDEDDSSKSSVKVMTYKPKNKGPYPVDTPKKNTIRFTPKQVDAIVSGTQPGLSVIVGPPGTGKTDVATQIINLLYHNFPSERILLIAHSNQALNQLFQKIIALDIDPRHLLRLGHGEEELDTAASYGKAGRVESFLEQRQYYLAEVSRLAVSLGVEGAHGSTCETADYFNQVYVKPAWTRFWETAKSPSASRDTIAAAFPFGSFFSNAPVPELFPKSASAADAQSIAAGCEHHLDHVFTSLASIRPFEVLRQPRDQANHLLVSEARIVAMTSTHASINRASIADLGFHFSSLVMEEAAQITELESYIPMALQHPTSALKRLILLGDHLQNAPITTDPALRQHCNLAQSLFQRLIRLGVPAITLDAQGRCRPSLARLFQWRYPTLRNLPTTSLLPEFKLANAGLRHEYQFLDVGLYNDQGEREPTPHFIQNLGEAEYAVALYQYMRLLGYPSSKIAILATYAGQRALIQDVLGHRCKGNRLFGMPKTVSTVDRYQGEENDFIILSLVRTKTVGYLRDVRRITVALSRARLGLYVLGRQELWEQCLELKPAMDVLLERPTKLEVVTGEMYPTKRIVDDEAQGTQIEGVEHLGQYVYEMTQAKVKALGGQILAEEGSVAEMQDEDHGQVDGEAEEEDPLHEQVI